MILIFLLHIIYFSSSGAKDAVLWNRLGADSFRWDEHIIFMIERISIFLIPSMMILFDLNLYDSIIITISSWFSFPFFHNGFYYTFRNLMQSSVYPKRFFDMSTTSTAKINFTPIIRIIFLAISIVTLIFYEFNKN